MSRLQTPPVPAELDDTGNGSSYVLEDVSWSYYEQTLAKLQRQNSHVRVTYDDGRMELMTLSSNHERDKTLVARMVELYALEKDISINGVGSLTLKRKDRRKGVEADESYYVKTPVVPRLKGALDLKKYPPPDLAIEIDVSYSSLDRQPIYGAIGVPEVWRVVADEVVVMHRRSDGKYKRANKSLAFPKLSISDFNRFLLEGLDQPQHQVLRAFRDYLRQST